MARPRGIRFYEVPLPQSIPEERKWLPDYHKQSSVLVQLL